jgi:hypothetical protein
MDLLVCIRNCCKYKGHSSETDRENMVRFQRGFSMILPKNHELA